MSILPFFFFSFFSFSFLLFFLSNFSFLSIFSLYLILIPHATARDLPSRGCERDLRAPPRRFSTRTRKGLLSTSRPFLRASKRRHLLAGVHCSCHPSPACSPPPPPCRPFFLLPARALLAGAPAPTSTTPGTFALPHRMGLPTVGGRSGLHALGSTGVR
jgi:hypothetical protein